MASGRVWSFHSFCDCLTALCLQCPAFVCMFFFPPACSMLVGKHCLSIFSIRNIHTSGILLFLVGEGIDFILNIWKKDVCGLYVFIVEGGSLPSTMWITLSLSLSAFSHTAGPSSLWHFLLRSLTGILEKIKPAAVIPKLIMAPRW